MIGDIPKGNGFMGAVRYDLQKEGARFLGGTLSATGDLEQIRREVRALRRLMPTLKNAVVHPSLNLAVGESLTDAQWLELSEKYLEKMGFGSCPYVVTRHTDASHDHVHLAVLRIDTQGPRVRSVSLHNDYARSARAIQSLEREYGLTSGALTPAEAAQQRRRPLTRKELVLADKYGITPVRELLVPVLDAVLEQSPASWTAFEEALAEHGVRPMLHAAKSGQVLGLSYEMDGRQAKSSWLGHAYTLSGLAQVGVPFEEEAHKDVVDRAVAQTSPEVQARMERREVRRVVREALEEVVSRSASPALPSFLAAMRSRGVEVRPHLQGTGRLSGLRYEVGGQSWKSSELGKVFGWKALESRGVSYEVERDLAEVREHLVTADALVVEPLQDSGALETKADKASGVPPLDKEAAKVPPACAGGPSIPAPPSKASIAEVELPDWAMPPGQGLGRAPGAAGGTVPPRAEVPPHLPVSDTGPSREVQPLRKAYVPEATPAAFELPDWAVEDAAPVQAPPPPPPPPPAQPQPPEPPRALRQLHVRYVWFADAQVDLAGVLAAHGHDEEAVAGALFHLGDASAEASWRSARQGVRGVDQAVDWLLSANRSAFRSFPASEQLGLSAGRLLREGVSHEAVAAALERAEPARAERLLSDLTPAWGKRLRHELRRARGVPSARRLSETELLERVGSRLREQGASRLAVRNALLEHLVDAGESTMGASRKVRSLVLIGNSALPDEAPATTKAYLALRQAWGSELVALRLDARAASTLLAEGHTGEAVARALLDHSPLATVLNDTAQRYARDVVQHAQRTRAVAERGPLVDRGPRPGATLWARGGVVHSPTDPRQVGAHLDLERQLDALGVLHFAVVVQRPGRGVRALGPVGEDRLQEVEAQRSRFTRRQLLARVGELERLNRRGWDVSLQPIDPSNHHVVVHTDRSGLERLRQDGHTPSLVLAAGHQLQVVLRVPRQGQSRLALVEHFRPYARSVPDTGRHQVAQMQLVEAHRVVDRGYDWGEDRGR